MRRAGQLAIILASLMLMTIKCSGGVNPGQARDTHQAIAAELTAATLDCIGNIGLVPHWSLSKIGNPHHSGSNIVGGLYLTVGNCPPKSGRIYLELEEFFHGKLGGKEVGWYPLAGPEHKDVGGHDQGDIIKFPGLLHFCTAGRWRLHAWGQGVAGDGTKRNVIECYPSVRCYSGDKGGLWVDHC